MNKGIFALTLGLLSPVLLLLTNLIHIRRKWVICWLLSLVCMFNALQGGGQRVLGQELKCHSNPEQNVTDSEFFMAQQPPPTEEFTGSCMKYVKVNVVFVLDQNGHGHYNQTGNWDDNTNSFNTSGYNGNQFAIDLVAGMNNILANNVPMNLCDGWAYYRNENFVELYDPTHPMPIQIPANFRFHLMSVNTISQQNLYDTVVSPDQSPPVPGFNNPNEIEIFCLPIGSGGLGYAIPLGGSLAGMAFVGGTRNAMPDVNLTLHEVGHTLALGHPSWHKYTCPALAACPSNDEVCKEQARKQCYEHPYWVPNYTCNTETDATFCNATSTNSTFVQMDPSNGDTNTPDALRNGNCGAGLFPDHPNGSPLYWLFPYCDQPEEITNNVMDYATSSIPHGFTEKQVCAIQTQLQISNTVKNYSIGGGATLAAPYNLFTYNFNGSDLTGWTQSDGVNDWEAQVDPNNCALAGVAHVETTTYSKRLLSVPISIPINAISMSITVNYCFSGNGVLTQTLKCDPICGASVSTDINDAPSGYVQNYTSYLSSFLGQNVTLSYRVNNGGIADIDKITVKIQTDDQITLPCNSALNFQTSCISDNGATITWDAPNDYVKINGDYTLRYKATSETEWTEINVVRAPFNNNQIGVTFPTQQYATLRNLVPCTQYEIQVKTVCNTCSCSQEAAEYSEYTPSLTFTTMGASCSSGLTIPVLPQIISSLGTNICAGYSTVLTTLPVGNTYNWSNNTTASSMAVDKSGTYTVTVTTLGGCTATSNIQISVNKPDFTLGPNHFICPNTPINYTLTPNYAGTGTYIWSTGAATSSINATNTGTYTLTITDSNACTATDNVIIDYKEGSDINLGNNIAMCNNVGLPIALDAGDVNCSYLWSTGAATPSISANAIGNYTVTVTAHNGCTSTDAISITNSNIGTPTISIIPNNCNVTLNALISGNVSGFLWSNGLQIQSIHPSVAGTYTVTVTNSQGCTATASATVADIPHITASIIPSNCGLTLTATGGNIFTWSTGVNTQDINVTTPGTYTVTVTNTQDGNTCTAVAQNTVTVSAFSGTYTIGAMANPLGSYNPATNTETWDNLNLRIAGNVIVPNGKRLVIKGGTTVEMIGTQFGFTVAKNAVLRIKESSTLTGDECQNNYWRGIVVNGNYQVAHPANYLTNGSTEHGVVIIEEQSTLKNASVGINSTDAVTANQLTLVTGGGIIYAQDALFTNNLTDININMQILGTHVANTQLSVIRRCTFLKDAPFLSGTTQKYVAIRLNSSSSTPTMLIHQNQFTTNNLSGENRGTGIRITNDKINIESQNVFSNLFKGIDAYNLLTTIKGVKVIGNQFVNVAKGVTLNNVVGGRVENNSFTIPTGSTGTDNDTYGLTLFEAKALNIKDNTFYAATNATYTRGFVTYKSNYTGYQTNVTNNLFDGGFEEATRFADNNRLLQMQCNAYSGCQKDWYFDIEAKLDQQGFCDLPQNSLRNHFHYLPPGIIQGDPASTWHLYINPSNTYFTAANKLTLRTDNSPQSLPTVINNVTITDAHKCFETESNFINNSCTVDFPTELWSTGCAWAGGSGGSNANLQATIYRLLQTEETDSLLSLLSCLNTDWAIRMLVGTYADNRNFTQALALLNLLPNTPENNEFVTIYTAIINELQGNTAGRTIPAKTILEKMAANQRRSEPNVLAETALASYFDYNYTRSFEREKTETAPTTLAQSSFSIVPNPTNNYFDLYMNSNSEQSQILSICDINGRLLQTVTINGQHSLVNVSHLPSGMYYCKLSNTNSVQKLVIIK